MLPFDSVVQVGSQVVFETATNKTLTEFTVKTDVEGQLIRWKDCLRVFITFVFVTHTYLDCMTETEVKNRVLLLAESNVEQESSVAVCSGVANWNCKYCFCDKFQQRYIPVLSKNTS
jgi:protein involved in ribonucleotide reduction